MVNNPVINPAANASPAPVVSTTSTLYEGAENIPSLVRMVAPSAPRVIPTMEGPNSRIDSNAFSPFSSVINSASEIEGKKISISLRTLKICSRGFLLCHKSPEDLDHTLLVTHAF